MKFSWKICVSVLAFTLLVMGIGGGILLSALFESSWQREVRNAAEENRMLQYSFSAYWNTTARSTASGSTDMDVCRAARAMEEGLAGTELNFRIYSQEGKELYAAGGGESIGKEERRRLQSAVSEETRGRILVHEGNTYRLVTAGSILMEDGTMIFLETGRDVTAVFEDRENQYAVYRRWMTGLLLMEGLGCYLIAGWLLRPLRRLSRAARRIAGGNLDVRAHVETGDEIGQLAEDFNHMADSLGKQFKELEEVSRRQEDFIGSFAHELKTPLTSMIGYADMLRTRDMSQEERFEAANYIFREGKRLEALSFKLLDLLVIRNGKLQKRPVRVQWLAEDIQGVLKPSLDQAGIKLKIIMEDEQAELEPDLMKTVLMNLLDNGRKAMDEGGILYLLGRKEAGGFAFYVRDTGKGMPEKELSRITEAFYMVDKSRARRQGGAGLGLSICAEIVKRHGGTMNFQSIEGKGTYVRVWLPDAREE